MQSGVESTSRRSERPQLVSSSIWGNLDHHLQIIDSKRLKSSVRHVDRTYAYAPPGQPASGTYRLSVSAERTPRPSSRFESHAPSVRSFSDNHRGAERIASRGLRFLSRPIACSRTTGGCSTCARRPDERNARRGDGAVAIDLRVAKTTKVGERFAATAFVEVFNVTNALKYGDDIGTVTSALFRQPTTAGQKRRAQLGFRVDF